MNEKLPSSQLRNKIYGFLKEHIHGALSTCKDNIPKSSPVHYFLGENFDLYILSAGGDKFSNIESNPNVCLLVNTEYVNYRKIKGVQIYGTAVTSINKPEIYEEAMDFSPDFNLMGRERDRLKIIKISPSEIIFINSLESGEKIRQVLNINEL